MTSTSLPKWCKRQAYRSSMDDCILGIPSFSNLHHNRINDWLNAGAIHVPESVSLKFMLCLSQGKAGFVFLSNHEVHQTYLPSSSKDCEIVTIFSKQPLINISKCFCWEKNNTNYYCFSLVARQHLETAFTNLDVSDVPPEFKEICFKVRFSVV